MDDDANIEGKIRCPILIVLGLCLLLVLMINMIQNNSESYLREKYLETNQRHYSGAIIDLLKERERPRYRDVRLSDKSVKKIPLLIYARLDVGDSIVKLKNSDSIIYIKKNGERIYDDINEFQRSKYLEKLRKN
jgi:hypothetical protein